MDGYKIVQNSWRHLQEASSQNVHRRRLTISRVHEAGLSVPRLTPHASQDASQDASQAAGGP